jgi:hypothetical protein
VENNLRQSTWLTASCRVPPHSPCRSILGRVLGLFSAGTTTLRSVCARRARTGRSLMPDLARKPRDNKGRHRRPALQAAGQELPEIWDSVGHGPRGGAVAGGRWMLPSAVAVCFGPGLSTRRTRGPQRAGRTQRWPARDGGARGGSPGVARRAAGRRFRDRLRGRYCSSRQPCAWCGVGGEGGGGVAAGGCA